MVRTVKIDEKFSKTFDRLFKYLSKAGDELTVESNAYQDEFYFDYGKYFESKNLNSIPIPNMFVEFIKDILSEYYDEYVSNYSYSEYEGDYYYNVIMTFFTNEKVIQVRTQVREATTDPHSAGINISSYSKEDQDMINEFMSENNTEIFTVDFSGGGDDGYINDYGMTSDDRKVVMPNPIENILYDLLRSNFGGWENDGGGEGEIIIDRENNKITINMVYIDSEYVDSGLRLNITQ